MLFLLPLLFSPRNMEWPAYGRDPGGQRYVGESQVDKSNVTRLRRAWEFHTGDLSDNVNKPSSAFECTPIFVDGTLYLASPFNRVFALDPDTGRAKWTYDPVIPREYPEAQEPFVCRGVSTWRNPTTGRRRIFLATMDARLIALNAATGRPLPDFGNKGTVDLKNGVGDRYLQGYNETSAPCVVGRLVVVGSSIADNGAVDKPSGVVRAYDAETGALKWSWDPVASLPDVAHSDDPTINDYIASAGGKIRTGAGNAWSTISADPDRDMVFVPTGSASPDFCGIQRPGDNADADSVVALKASTGEKIWSFQVVHHDLWDYDVPAEPILCDVDAKPAVVVMSKMGHVFVLDRLTGKSLFPIEERKVPQDTVPGEPASPTQPFPVLPKPLVPTQLEPWAVTDANNGFLKNELKGVKQEGIFGPPSVHGTLVFPGNLGGCNWSGGSYDPNTNTLFVNTNELATLIYLIPREKYAETKAGMRGHEVTAQLGTPYGMRREWLLSPGQVPGNRPPWGLLHAIDLKTGTLRWEAPVGGMPQYAELPQARKWGSPNLGGSFVTSTGLVFISAGMDCKLRAYDSATGEVVWEANLPAGGQAAPMTYVSPKTGRQYIVQCAGGHHGLGTKEGDSVVAFALPR